MHEKNFVIDFELLGMLVTNIWYQLMLLDMYFDLSKINLAKTNVLKAFGS